MTSIGAAPYSETVIWKNSVLVYRDLREMIRAER